MRYTKPLCIVFPLLGSSDQKGGKGDRGWERKMRDSPRLTLECRDERSLPPGSL